MNAEQLFESEWDCVRRKFWAASELKSWMQMNLSQITSTRKTQKNLSLYCESVCVWCCVAVTDTVHYRTLCRTLFVCECVFMCLSAGWVDAWKPLRQIYWAHLKTGFSERVKERKRAFFHNKLQPSFFPLPPSFFTPSLPQSNSTSFFLFFSPSLPSPLSPLV